MITTALEHVGHRVVSARDGEEGLSLVRDVPPCIILLDLMMPRMDGLTFLSEREKRHVAVGVPVVCISAAPRDWLTKAMSLGASECLAKPFDIDELYERVGFYCGQRPAS